MKRDSNLRSVFPKIVYFLHFADVRDENSLHSCFDRKPAAIFRIRSEPYKIVHALHAKMPWSNALRTPAACIPVKLNSLQEKQAHIRRPRE